MLLDGREVSMGKNCDWGLENFQARGHSFAPYGPTLSRQKKKLWPRSWKRSSPRPQFRNIQTDPKPANNMFIFPPALNWFYRLQMALFAKLLSMNQFVRRLITIRKKILAMNE